MQFKWLEDYQKLEDHLVYLKWNLNKSRLELDRWVNGDLANVRLEKNSRSSSLEESIEKIEQEIKRLEEQKGELLSIVRSFKGLDNDIVRLKYIDGYSLEEVAEETDYSASYIRQRHAEIRKTLQFLDQYQTRQSNNLQRKSEIDFYSKELDKKK